ncbi:MAG: hypothetical protein DYG94_13630 [Leptolyngbya sp. PLA3]|nr:MAG: hypothetical protein EDM82_14185 [Cyanobacteria bacterium CYA]MCE7969767.1 hypothetical protein [Leptolyngbya sp. PL-A3]
MEQLVIATQNPGKVAELRELLSDLRLEVLGLDDLGRSFDEPPEHGRTFEENAALKALAYARMTGLPCLADDSGLEVDALDGRPGVDSAWYAYASEADAKAQPRSVRDPKNNDRLLGELEGVEWEQRTARFVCCMALGRAGFQPAESPPATGRAGFQPASSPSREPYDGHFRIHDRHLSHWQVRNATYFVTWRLASGELAPDERQVVLDACQFWNGSKINLHAAVVMPDHVHMLFRICEQPDGSWPDLPGLMHSIKRHTALAIQKMRGKRGPLWQQEYFDRIMRDADEIAEKYHYIENNAVKSGLCEEPGTYPFLVRFRDRLETGSTTILAVSRGTFEGRIGIPPRVPAGDNGFGYDPIFLVAPGFALTSAELSPQEKNRLSHRAAAARQMCAHIAHIVSESRSK